MGSAESKPDGETVQKDASLSMSHGAIGKVSTNTVPSTEFECCCGIRCPTAQRLFFVATAAQIVLVIWGFASSFSGLFGGLFLGLMLVGMLAWSFGQPFLQADIVANVALGGALLGRWGAGGWACRRVLPRRPWVQFLCTAS